MGGASLSLRFSRKLLRKLSQLFNVGEGEGRIYIEGRIDSLWATRISVSPHYYSKNDFAFSLARRI